VKSKKISRLERKRFRKTTALRAVFWNQASRGFYWSINSRPKILRSRLLHWLLGPVSTRTHASPQTSKSRVEFFCRFKRWFFSCFLIKHLNLHVWFVNCLVTLFPKGINFISDFLVDFVAAFNRCPFSSICIVSIYICAIETVKVYEFDMLL